MSPERKKLFGCPVCGFRVTGSEDVCPRCGTKYGKDTKFECPFCGDLVSPSSPRCPSCRVSYEEFLQRTAERHSDESVDSLLTEIIDQEAELVKNEDKRLSCPRCSWMLDGTEEKCPKCGAGFLDDVSYQCPICAAMVKADAVRCEECGTLFAEVEEPVRAEEEQAPVTTAPAQPEPEPAPAAETPRPEPAAARPEPVIPPQPEPATIAPETPAVREPQAETPAEPMTPTEPEAKPKQKKLKTRKVKVRQ